MLLKDYRKKTAKSRARVGVELGVNAISIWRWETGRSIPEPQMMIRIKEWSAGEVCPDDLLAMVPGVRK